MIEHNFKKKFGQNFLQDRNIIEKIVKVASPNTDDLIIEIGPGSGALTEVLTKYCKTISYEIDVELKPILEDKFSDNANSQIIFDDFLNRNIKNDIEKYKYNKLYVIANLPYYITTPIIEKIINEKLDIEKMVIMVQKEVGDRFSSKPKSKEYSSITVYLNYYFDINREFIVSRNSFIPKPNVDSIVITLKKKNNLLYLKDKEIFNKLLKDAFKYKRKNIKNNLKNYNLDLVSNILLKYNFNLNSRAEELPLEVFIDISNNL